MQKFLGFIFLLSLFQFSQVAVSAPYLGQSKHLGLQAVYQYFDSKVEIEKGLKSKDLIVKSKAMISCLVAWEHADGVNGIETSYMLMPLWLTDAELLFTWFQSNQIKAKRWLSSQDYIFNGLSEIYGASYAKELRDNMIKKFSQMELKFYQAEFFEKYIAVLKKIEFYEPM